MEKGWGLFYVVGCVAALAAMCISGIVVWLVRWITKSNVVEKNLKKLEPRDASGFATIAVLFVVIVIVEVALSWLAVLYELWRAVYAIFDAVRDMVASKPDAVRILRFPLRNNRELSREAVWAHVVSLAVVNGQHISRASELFDALRAVCDAHPTFDRVAALRHLKALRFVDSDVVAELLSEFADGPSAKERHREAVRRRVLSEMDVNTSP